MRISDWSSDVCSSDLPRTAPPAVRSVPGSGTETTVSAATIQAAPGSDGRCGRRRAYAGTARTQSRRGDAGERPAPDPRLPPRCSQVPHARARRDLPPNPPAPAVTPPQGRRGRLNGAADPGPATRAEESREGKG